MQALLTKFILLFITTFKFLGPQHLFMVNKNKVNKELVTRIERDLMTK